MDKRLTALLAALLLTVPALVACTGGVGTSLPLRTR